MPFPMSRVIALIMAAVLCFVLLVPIALATHHALIAVLVVVIFFAYLAVNMALWRRS